MNFFFLTQSILIIIVREPASVRRPLLHHRLLLHGAVLLVRLCHLLLVSKELHLLIEGIVDGLLGHLWLLWVPSGWLLHWLLHHRLLHHAWSAVWLLHHHWCLLLLIAHAHGILWLLWLVAHLEGVH